MRKTGSVLVLLLLAGLASAPAASAAGRKAPANPQRACLVALEKAAAKGNGGAAKTLAIYFAGRHKPRLARAYRAKAIKAGADVAHLRGQSIANLADVCRRDPQLHGSAPASAARPTRTQQAKSPPSADARAAAPAQAAATAAQKKKPRAAARPRESGKPAAGERSSPTQGENGQQTGADFERQAEQLEAAGKVADALPWWVKARESGSRYAAKRLYQIYCFGAGDVDADYVKAIAAAESASKLGVAVPPLPRK